MPESTAAVPAPAEQQTPTNPSGLILPDNYRMRQEIDSLASEQSDSQSSPASDDQNSSEPEGTPETETTETQRQELRIVSNSLLSRKGADIDNTTTDRNQRETPANSAAIWWSRISNTNSELDFNGGSLALPEGREITKIQGVNEHGDFVCQIKNPGGTLSEETIVRQNVLDIQLLTEQEHILSLFPPGSPERNAIQLQIDLLTNPAQSPSADRIDQVIQEAGKINGFLAASDIERMVAFRKTALDRDNKKDGIQQAQELEWLSKILSSIEGKNIVGHETIKLMISSPDFNDQYEALARQVEQMSKSYPSDNKDLIHLRAVKAMLDVAKTKLNDPSFDFKGTPLEGIANGTADTETVKTFLDSIKNNDLLSAIDKLYPAKNKEEELLRAEVFKKRKGLMLQLLFILGKVALDELFGEFMPSLDQRR